MEEQERSESIFEMIDSDFDSFTGSMSPEDAKRSIAQARKATADPEHIYNKSGFGHQKAVDRMNKLYQAAAPPEGEPAVNADGEEIVQKHWPPQFIKAMEEGLAEQAAKQEVLVASAQESIDFLVEQHGYQRDEVPKDIQPFVVNLLRAQVLNRSDNTPENLDELSRILEKEAHSVPFDPKLREAITQLNYSRRTLSKDPDFKDVFSALVEQIIFKLDSARDKMRPENQKGTKAYMDKLLKNVETE